MALDRFFVDEGPASFARVEPKNDFPSRIRELGIGTGMLFKLVFCVSAGKLCVLFI
jgi:hypothetical protein